MSESIFIGIEEDSLLVVIACTSVGMESKDIWPNDESFWRFGKIEHSIRKFCVNYSFRKVRVHAHKYSNRVNFLT